MKYLSTLFFLFSIILSNAQVTYVNEEASGNNNGSSWADAYTDLLKAIDETEAGDIWIAEGLYKCTEGSDRSVSFQIKKNVNLFGGFSKTNNPEWEDRSWKDFPTLLSGDLGVENDTSDNTFHILKISGSFNPITVTIDGLTFVAGNSDYAGGAIDISGSFDMMSEVTIQNCYFKNNYADYEGAAIDVYRTNVIVDNCFFEENYAGYEGGAISYFSGFMPLESPQLICKNSIFRNNFAEYSGGAVETRGKGSFYNCLFDNNYADYEGGAISHFDHGNLDMVNCTFVNNSSGGDGSVLDIFTWSDTVVVGASFINCIFNGNIGNELISVGGEVDDVSISYSLLDGCPSDVMCGDGNIYSDTPGFQSIENQRLTEGSLCIDAGINMSVPDDITKDLDGNSRIIGDKVDLGAYEYDATLSNSSYQNLSITVFPNPVERYFSIKTDEKSIHFLLINAQGQTLKQWEINNNNSNSLFDIQDLSNGFYFLIVDNGKERYKTKIVKI